ncbi:MAG: hypothetical protein FWG21_05130 [Oscillospiraceae bacterium]|nr:hypothetical protein [Oscillospiraceae bacterium]
MLKTRPTTIGLVFTILILYLLSACNAKLPTELETQDNPVAVSIEKEL